MGTPPEPGKGNANRGIRNDRRLQESEETEKRKSEGNRLERTHRSSGPSVKSRARLAASKIETAAFEERSSERAKPDAVT